MKTSFKKTAQKGFTLIELIITIVIIGILAAVAIPKLTGLSAEANLATAKGVAGAVASASSVNYAKKAGGVGGVAIGTCVALKAANLVDLPTGFDLTELATPVALPTNGDTGQCIITGPSSTSFTFAAYGAP